jgi:hypothetical protein
MITWSGPVTAIVSNDYLLMACDSYSKQWLPDEFLW